MHIVELGKEGLQEMQHDKSSQVPKWKSTMKQRNAVLVNYLDQECN